MPKLKPITPLVPREMIVAPFFAAVFAAVKQSQERAIVVDGKRWVIGLEHPPKRRSPLAHI